VISEIPISTSRARRVARLLTRVGITVVTARSLRGKWTALDASVSSTLALLGFPRRPRIVRLVMPRVTINVNTARRDLVGYWEIWLERESEPTSTFRAAAGDTIVDVGANVGFYALKRALDSENARVIAIEPDPQTFDLLQRNIRDNHADNVECLNLAVSDAEGELWFLSDHVSLNSRVVSQREPGAVAVAATTLDALVGQLDLTRIDFLKIDTEGHELAVLRGAEHAALPITSRVAVEWHSLDDRAAIFNLLAARSFSFMLEKRDVLFFARGLPTGTTSLQS